MTSAGRSLQNSMTVAHWGSYCIDAKGAGSSLMDNPADPAPSLIGTGWMSACLDAHTRIARPAVRRGWLEHDRGENRCDDSYVEMSWDEVIEIAGDEIKRVIQSHGNKAIYGGSYGWASAGRFHHSQSQLRRFLNLQGGYVAARDTYSHAAAEVIFPYLTGYSNKEIEEGLTSWPLIADHCSLLLAFGGISERTAQIASGGTWAHEVGDWLQRAAEQGMKTVSVSPLKSDYQSGAANSWMPLRPGTDVALILALSHELIKNDWHDVAFLERYTFGFAPYQAYVLGETDGIVKSAEWAAQICDVAVDDIRSLAKRISEEKVMVSVAWGMQRADHGEQVVWAALALSCLLGQIGQPGLGFGFGYGSTTPPGRPKRFVSWPAMPQGQNKIADFIPVARVADMLLHPGETYTYDGETRTYPDIKLIYWCGGNPFHHQQDLNRLQRAWCRPETVIVQDHSWTATAKRADIVLPATTALERNDIFMNRRDPHLVAMRQVVKPLADARDDFDIFRGLSRYLGVEQAFTENQDPAAWQAALWEECRKTATAAGFELPDYEGFLADGHVEIPQNEETRVLFSDFIADPTANPLATDSGKINIFCTTIAELGLSDCKGHPVWLPPIEWLGEAASGALHLISNQPKTRLHSQLDNGKTSRESKHNGREICTLHPSRAKALGLCAGDVAKLYNQRGACLAAIALDENMRADCVVLPTGAWLDLQQTSQGTIDVHGNPNVLTLDKGASGLTQGNISHTALVWIEKWTDDVPDIKAFDPPPFVHVKEA